MPSIHIAYDSKNSELINQIASQLKKLGYIIHLQDIPPTSEPEIGLVFLPKPTEEDWLIAVVDSEQRVIYELIGYINYADSQKARIIVLVPDSLSLPKDLAKYPAVFDDNGNTEKVVKEITTIIKERAHSSRLTDDKYSISIKDGYQFARMFYEFLKGIKKGTSIGQWNCDGLTEIAFGTPAGPWDKEGFIFRSENHSFIIRSVARYENSYLVVESVKLKSQLANLALNNGDKFQLKNDQVSIIETYDMTVGSGRRSRNTVRDAFRAAGMKSQTIAQFNFLQYSRRAILLDILKWAEYRERAKELLQNAPGKQEKDPEIKHWLLKIHGPNWRSDELDVGSVGFFHADHPSRIERQEYSLFTMVRNGDIGVAIDDSEEGDLIFMFEVTTGLQRESDSRQRFMFRITATFRRFNFDAGAYSDLYEIIRLRDEGDQRLYELTEAEFQNLFNIIQKAKRAKGTTSLINNTATLSQVFSDSADQQVKDSLGFQKDVDALASVMVYREVTPPLAIGLFGNWGTGKSFFINKLQRKIKELSSDDRGVFCKKVLQINFNSWHYSDSNLWASLVTKIFEELATFESGKPNELSDLFQQLNSAKELIAETKQAKSAVDRKINSLTEEKSVFEKQAAEKVTKLKNLSFKHILNGLMENTSVQNQFNSLKENYKFLKLDVIENINDQVNEIDDYSNILRKSISIVPEFLKSWRLVATLIMFGVLIGGMYYLSAISEAVKDIFKQAEFFFYVLSGILASGLNILRPAMIKVRDGFNLLVSLKATVKKLEVKADEEFIDKRKVLNDQLIAAETNSQQLNTEIQQLQLKQQKLQGDINDITSGKKVIRFIESRVSDERYINSLGIISWVRRDFEQLDALLGQQKAANRQDKDNESEVKPTYHLERIILYIDDLDRCQESIVVKVLEAINLLLAFPLFVVVVGVDPRWMHNALHLKYPHLKNVLKTNLEDSLPADQGSDLLAATSADYLEKIFQIPFALKAITQAGKASLIDDQLKVRAEQPSNSVVQLELEQRSSVNISDESVVETENETSAIIHKTYSSETPAVETTKTMEEISSTTTIDVTRLLITEAEIELMKALSFMIGDSPRTIKRFINIYRIIRTHEGFVFEGEYEQAYHFAALVILAILTGRSPIIGRLLKCIENAKNNMPFVVAISNDAELTAKDKLSLNDLLELISSAKRDSAIFKISELNIREFKANAELVTRFSFSN